MTDYFFKLKVDDQLEKIIKSKDLCLLQAIIGKRCPAFLQYCASFYISKINVLEARKQVEKVTLRALEYYFDEVQNGEKPETLTLTSPILNDVVREGRLGLTSNSLLTNVSLNSKFLLSSDYKTAQNYVQETNIGNLCMMSLDMIDGIYENLIKYSLSHIDISGNLKDVKDRLENFLQERDSIKEETDQELRQYKNSLTEMKDATFLQKWYDTLLIGLINAANNFKNHLLHKDVYYHSKGKELDTAQENLIKSKIYTIKNKEIFKMAFFKILQSNVTNKEEMEKTFTDVLKCENIELCNENIMTKSFVNNLKQVLNEDKTFTSNEIIKFFLDNISLSWLLDAEQTFLDKMLLLAHKHKQNDAALLLILNGANFQRIGKLNALPLQKPLILEIKRLYKGMPNLSLPSFTLNDLTTLLPDDFLLHKISEFIIQQNDSLKEKKEATDKFLKNWENSNFFIHWIIKQIYNFKIKRVKNAEAGMKSIEKSLNESAGLGAADLFFEELYEMIKVNGISSLNKVTFRKLEELGDEIEDSSLLTVETFARNLNFSKQDFITGQREREQISQMPEHSMQKVHQLTIETIEMAELKEKEETKRSTMKAITEQLRREREEALIEKNFMKAKSEAYELLYEEAKERGLQVKNFDLHVKNKLMDFFAYFILNTHSHKELKDIYASYEMLEKEFEAKLIDHISLNQKLSKLNAQFAPVKSWFLRRQSEEIKLLDSLTLFPDEAINDFLKSVVEQMKSFRSLAIKELMKIEIIKNKFL